MSEDSKQPGSDEPTRPDASKTDSSGQPKPSENLASSPAAGSDAEKASLVEQAKSRVASIKEALPADATIPKPPVKKKMTITGLPANETKLKTCILGLNGIILSIIALNNSRFSFRVFGS